MTNPMSKVLQHLRTAVLPQDGAGLTDGQLLGCFIEHQDEAAFATLVRRHGAMVWGTCRRLLGHHDAEDAFQATFLVLVRKAASIRPREMVANWLHGVAHQAALQARRTVARRRARERQVVEMAEAEAEPQDRWADLRPLLDQELSRLPDRYRVVVVLCDLEGKTRKDAARQLGLPEGTVGSRLARARTRLAKRLARHGLAMSGEVLAAVLSRNSAAAAVPSSVVPPTIKAATSIAAGQSAASEMISIRVAALTQGVLNSMLVSKLKMATAVVLLVVLLGIGVGVLRTSAAEQSVSPAADRPQRGVRVKWEYKGISPAGIEKLAPKGSKDRLTDGLNELGDQGWELAAVQPGATVTTLRGSLPSMYVFKRPK